MSEPTMEEKIAKRKNDLIFALMDDMHSLTVCEPTNKKLFRDAVFSDLRAIIKAVEDGL